MMSFIPTGTPASGPLRPAAVDRPRLGDRLFRIQPRPGLDPGAGASLFEAGTRQGLGRQLACGELGDRF